MEVTYGRKYNYTIYNFIIIFNFDDRKIIDDIVMWERKKNYIFEKT